MDGEIFDGIGVLFLNRKNGCWNVSEVRASMSILVVAILIYNTEYCCPIVTHPAGNLFQGFLLFYAHFGGQEKIPWLRFPEKWRTKVRDSLISGFLHMVSASLSFCGRKLQN